MISVDGGPSLENLAYPARAGGCSGYRLHAAVDHFFGRAYPADRGRNTDFSGFIAGRSGLGGTAHAWLVTPSTRRFVARTSSAGYRQGSAAGNFGERFRDFRTNPAHANQSHGALGPRPRRRSLHTAARLATTRSWLAHVRGIHRETSLPPDVGCLIYFQEHAAVGSLPGRRASAGHFGYARRR